MKPDSRKPIFECMIFELTDLISKEIIFAMENQNETCFFDSKSKKVISATELEANFQEEEINRDEENIYSLPAWSSGDGYKVLEKFTQSLHSPKIQKELETVLANGRGVFKNFKNVLKSYPEIYRRFDIFKENEMRLRLMDWYNALRELWGLEKLEQEYYENDGLSDKYDDLLREDFLFREYDSIRDKNLIDENSSAISEELIEKYPGELGQVCAQLWEHQYKEGLSDTVNGFVCRTLEDEFAGCLLYSTIKTARAEHTVSLSACFVNQNYRGLGIAKELFSISISYLRNHGIHWFVIANQAVPQILESTLSQLGFEKKDSIFVAKLSTD